MEKINISSINRPNEDVVSYLEDLLEEAKKGKITSLCVITSTPDYSTGNGWAGMNKNNMAMIGEIETLKRDILEEFIEKRP